MADDLQLVMVDIANTGTVVVTVLLTVNVIATFLVFLRWFARTKLSKNLGRDDLMLVLGWVRTRP